MDEKIKILSIAELIKSKSVNYIVPTWDFFANILTEKDWEEIFHPKNLRIDLKQLNNLPPDGFTWISYIFIMRRILEKSSSVVLPDDEDQVHFLKYLKFDILIKDLNVSMDNYFDFENLISIYQPKINYKKVLRQQKLVTNTFMKDEYRKYKDELISILLTLINPGNKNPEIIRTDESYYHILMFCQIFYEMVENIISHGGPTHGEGIGLFSLVPPPPQDLLYPLVFNDCGNGFIDCFLNELEKYTNNKQVKLVLTDIKRFNVDSEEYFKRILGYIFIYRYINPDKKGYVGFYKILPFLSLFQAEFFIRTDKFYCEANFSNTNFYTFQEEWENPTIDWICSYIKTPVKKDMVKGSHIKINLKLINRG